MWLAGKAEKKLIFMCGKSLRRVITMGSIDWLTLNTDSFYSTISCAFSRYQLVFIIVVSWF